MIPILISKGKRYVGLSLLICYVAIALIPIQKTSATSKYITVEEFAKALARELGLKSISGEQDSGFVNALIKAGIIKKGDVTSYTSDLRRTDAMVFINRADEYLYGNKTDEKLVQTVVEKRISDINKIKLSKREDVAKAYIKGYMKGFSNGTYALNREMRGSNRITKSGALNMVKMLKDQSLRALISPDGQLIRTTNLPIYAEHYPYILASYPNAYYDWKFEYEIIEVRRNGKLVTLKELDDYASPKNVRRVRDNRYTEMIDEKVDSWVEKAEVYLDNIFNVDYRTIDNSWIDNMIDTCYGFKYNEPWNRQRLGDYVSDMKKNKTIVESSMIRVDRSSLYYSNGRYFIRAYVRYRVVSSNTLFNQSVDSIINQEPHNRIIFSPALVDLRGVRLNRWEHGYFEVQFGEFMYTDLDVSSATINSPSYDYRKVSK